MEKPFRILFLTDNFPPEVNAPANRTFEHCREWVREGTEVTVITGAPNFPVGKVFPGYRNRFYQEEWMDGIRVIRVWTYITANEGFLKRILDYMSFGLMAFFAGLRIKTDLIVATSPQFFTAVAGRWLSLFKRTKWVMEVRDLWPESILAVGAMKRGPAIRYFEWLEKRLYRSANHIIVVTDTFKEKIAGKDIPREKISVFKNGANLQNYHPASRNDSLLRELGLQDKFIVAYIGTHGMAHALNFILDAIKPLEKKCPDLFFLFIGDGAEKKNLLTQARELQLQNAHFLDSVPKERVPEYLSLMDVSLVNLRRSETFTTVIPSKIFEAAAMEKPILLGLEGETKDIIEKYGAGVCFVPEDQDSFYQMLNKIRSPEIYESVKQGTRRLIRDFDRLQIARQMLNCLKSV